MKIFLSCYFYENSKSSFIYLQRNFYSNEQYNQPIKSLEVLAGTEKYSFTPPYNSKTINFTPTQVGKQIISFKATFEDGTVATTKAEIETNDTSTFRVGVEPCYKPAALNPSISSKANIVADVPFQNYNNGSWIFGRGEVGYYYAKNKICGNNTPQTLTKPIIFIDGFDALDKRPISEIYDKNLAFEQNGTPENLGKKLRDKDYDLIVLNFPTYVINGVAIDGGTDYIERNAMVLVKLIQQVNAELAAQGNTEKLVIVGPSMGGLISQYALAYMEKYRYWTSNPVWEHNTRLWISFDAPHNGANIPIGAQEFLRFWASKGVSVAEGNWVNSINSTAARQMLLHHCDQPNSFFPINVQAHAYRSPFLANVANNGLPGSNGFPTQLRKLAISSGSQAGALTGVANQITITTSTRVRVWGHDAAEVGVSEIRNTGSYGGSNQVFYGWKRFNSPHNSSCFGPVNSVSYDTAPGGVFNVYEIIKEDGQGNSCSAYPTPFGNLPSVCPFAGLWVNTDATLINPYHCFIPTKSALGFKGTNQDLGENFSGRSLVCTNETPFDAYYAPSANEGHIQLNAGNVAWIMPELDGIKNVNPAPYPMNFQVAIVADPNNSNCINQPQTYSIDPNSLPVPAADIISVNWISEGNLTIQSVNTRDNVTVINNGISFGRLRVEVIVRGTCLGKGIGAVDLGPTPNYTINFTELTGNTLCKGNTLRYTLRINGQLVSTMVGTPQYTVSSNLQIINPNPNNLEVLILEAGASSINVTTNYADPCRGNFQGVGVLYFEASSPPLVGKFSFPNVSYDACFGTYSLIISPNFNATDVSINGAPFVPITGPIELSVGTYTIALSNSCGVSATRTMTISAAPMGCKTVVSAKDTEITVSPNPANTYLDVSNILAGSEVKIYTKMGVLVHSEKSENDKIRLDISKFNTDLYILEAVLPNNVRVRKQIIKQ